MRYYSYITVGQILEELKAEGVNISKNTFINLMLKKGLFMMGKTAGGWYTCSEIEKRVIIRLVKENYSLHKN